MPFLETFASYMRVALSCGVHLVGYDSSISHQDQIILDGIKAVKGNGFLAEDAAINKQNERFIFVIEIRVSVLES